MSQRQNLKTDSNTPTPLSQNKQMAYFTKKNLFKPQNPSKLCQIN